MKKDRFLTQAKKEASKDISEADLYKASSLDEIVKLTAYKIAKDISEGKDEDIKEAAAVNIPWTALGIGAGGYAAGELMDALRSRALGKRVEKSREHIIKVNPDLAKKADFENNFGVISQFAPRLAANPVVAQSLLQGLSEWGRIDLNTLSKMIDSERAQKMQPRANSISPQILMKALTSEAFIPRSQKDSREIGNADPKGSQK